MKSSTKRLLGFFSWIPLLIIAASIVYMLTITRHLVETEQFQQHDRVVGYLSYYYGHMFAWFAVASTIAMIISVIFAVHILRLKYMHPATKAIWFLALCALFPFGLALPLFYHLELSQEPDDIAMLPSIE